MSNEGWSRPAVLLHEPSRRLAHFVRQRVVDINAIDNADNRSFDRHVLISDRRSRCFAKRAHHHFAGAGTETIGNDDDVARRLFVEIVRMDNQKPDALEIGRLLRRPDCAYNFG